MQLTWLHLADRTCYDSGMATAMHESCTPADLVLVSEARRLASGGAGRAIRIAAGLSVYEIAKACGVYPSTVLRWERGDTRPRGLGAAQYALVLRELARPPR